MKKVLISLCCLLTAVALFAQSPELPEIGAPASLENEVTAGMFSNEIDNQFAPGADFGSYDQHFIYGGLGNPGHLFKANQSKEEFNKDTPFKFGYYMPWKFPMSFYAAFGATGGIKPGAGGTETVWDGLEHKETKTVTKTSYYPAPLFQESAFNFQYLIGLGTGMNLVTGVQFAYTGDRKEFEKKEGTKIFRRIEHEDKKTAANSFTLHMKGITNGEGGINDVTKYVDLALGTDVAFHTTLQAPFSNTNASNLRTHIPKLEDTFALKIPVAFTTGKFNHVAAVLVGSKLTSQNGYYYYKGNEGKVEKKVNISSVTANTDLRLEYGIEIPAADRETDNWTVNTALVFNFNSGNTHAKYLFKDTASATKLDGKGEFKVTPKTRFGFAFEVSGGRTLKFASPKKAVLFAMKPELKLAVETRKGSAAGSNWKSTGTINNKSYVASVKTESSQGQYIDITTFKSTVSVPMGLRLLPENWKVGFLLGATPSIESSVTITTNTSAKHKEGKTTTVTTDISGTQTTKTEGGEKYYGSTYNSAHTPNYGKGGLKFKETHSIGITIPFEGGAHLDAKLEGTLLDINKFTIQAFIPLGSGKKAAAESSDSAPAPAPAETAANE